MLAVYVFLFLAAGVSAVYPTQFCKPQPGSAAWPSTADWQALNASISGRLAAVVPPGAVCHPGQPTYNSATCAVVAAQWSNSSFHAGNPWSVDYNDDTCLPSPAAPCSSVGYPAYAVEAIKATDVQAAVRFAGKTGVRLVVKGTGHDYPGRSSGSASLEIWTHLLTGIDFNTASQSVTIHAGTRMHELYTAVGARSLTVVGGSDPSVGIGGWIMNAGHSPVSSVYGLGADQVLSMDVVTADGQLRTLNPQSANQDLFWAVRGGGGSTFAVMLTVTVKTYPVLPGVVYSISYSTTASSDTFWNLATYWSSKMPDLSDAGGMGYYFLVPDTGSLNRTTAGSVSLIFIFPNKTATKAKAIIDPIQGGFQSGTDPVYNTTTVTPFPNFMNAWLATQPEAVGSDSRLGSWLLDRDALAGNNVRLQTALRTAIPAVAGAEFLGNLVAGKGVKNAQIPTGSNAVLPAWRNAYVHAIVPVAWAPLNTADKTTAANYLRAVIDPTLKNLAPTSGAYVNEADPTNPNWQNDYYGSNYARLLSIKKKWDPQGVFWCKPCVGNELWQWVNGTVENPLEWGVGQDAGKLCRI